jgi:hypothetical protein
MYLRAGRANGSNTRGNPSSTMQVFGYGCIPVRAAPSLLFLIHPSAGKDDSQEFLRSWNVGPSVLARSAYFHVPDESVSDAVDVLHPTVRERTAVLVEHTLVNLNHDTAVWLGTEGLRFDKRVDEAPLARPICSHALVSIDVAALHGVGPLHVRVHHRKYRIDVARVERSVRPAQEFPNVGGYRLSVQVPPNLLPSWLGFFLIGMVPSRPDPSTC